MSLSFRMVAEATRCRAHVLLPQWLPHGRWVGPEWVARNPRRGDRHLGSFSVNRVTGAWADFAIGERGGDLISLYAYLYNMTQAKACCELSRLCGTVKVSGFYPACKQGEDSRKLARAKAIWESAQPLAGNTLAATYLGLRGLSFEVWPATLRWHPSVFEPETQSMMPALIAKIEGVHGEFLGIHRIYLSPLGQKAALQNPKKMLGNISGGAVHLAESTHAVAIAEGIETGLALMQLMDLPVWAALSTTGLENVKIPESCHSVYIAIDHDRNGAGARAGQKLAKRLQAEGKQCFILDPATKLPLPKDAKGVDWLDVLAAEMGDTPHGC